MAKGTRQPRKGGPIKGAQARPRSFSCTDDDWKAVERFASRRGLASTSDAVRRLLRSGLHTEQMIEEIATAQEWQLAQAWADAEAIAAGDRAVGSWERIAAAGERARARIRERVAAERAVRTGS